MNVLAVLLLVSYAVAHGGDDQHGFKNWTKIKAMESCWGEENMQVYTVNMKKAVAKCNQVDAPELELPPYRSVDRFVNTMLNFARDSFMMKKMMPYDKMKSQNNNKYGSIQHNKMDMDKFEKMYKMISEMKSDNYMSNDSPAVMPIQRSVMPNFMETPDFEKMANFMMNLRSKRQTSDDALAHNLKEKIQSVFEEQQYKIGNTTCVLREMNCLNTENKIDVRAMKKDAEQYNMSGWFKDRYEEIIDVCYKVATNLPAKLDEINKGDFGTVNMGHIKSFMGCCKTANQKLCMNQDIKNKIETNFGPVQDILESFNYQISENQLFTQVHQLLQGSEDQYM